MKIGVIKNEQQHREALKAIERLWGASPGTAKGDLLDLLTTLTEAYEEKRHAILPPDPIEAIKFRMEQEGLTQTDLIKALGGRNRVSEVMRKKRPLTLGMIRNLHRQLHIPAESLISST